MVSCSKYACSQVIYSALVVESLNVSLFDMSQLHFQTEDEAEFRIKDEQLC